MSYEERRKPRVGISTQMSVGVLAATTGEGSGGLKTFLVASGYTDTARAMFQAGRASDNATDKIVCRSRAKKVRGANSRYKVALRYYMELSNKNDLTPKELEDLSWARKTINESRARLDGWHRYASQNPEFCNRIEESTVNTIARKMLAARRIGGNVTATITSSSGPPTNYINSTYAISDTGNDSDVDTSNMIDEDKEESFLRAPRVDEQTIDEYKEESFLTAPRVHERTSRRGTNRENRKALVKYKAALKYDEELVNKKNLTQEEMQDLSRAKETITDSRAKLEGKLLSRDPNYCNKIEENTRKKVSRAIMERANDTVNDSDRDTTKTIVEDEEERLIRSPKMGEETSRRMIPRSRPSKEDRKALAKYKAALRYDAELGSKKDLTQKELQDLYWAKKIITASRAYLDGRKCFASRNPEFCNKIEEDTRKKLMAKRQCLEDASETQSTIKKPKISQNF